MFKSCRHRSSKGGLLVELVFLFCISTCLIPIVWGIIRFFILDRQPAARPITRRPPPRAIDYTPSTSSDNARKVAVSIGFFRKTIHRTYRNANVAAGYFSNSFDMLDMVLLERAKKKKKVRAKGWMIQLDSTKQASISLDATDEEIDEFCGLYWSEVYKT